MSSSIRPPSGGPPGIGPFEPGGAAEAAKGAGPAQQQGASDATRAQAGHGAATGAIAHAESPAAQWLRRLEAGEISRAQAIDGLVAQAMEQRGAQHLSPSQRGELEGLLRAALVGDPVLGRLLGDA